jgi:hypothetical protein
MIFWHIQINITMTAGFEVPAVVSMKNAVFWYLFGILCCSGEWEESCTGHSVAFRSDAATAVEWEKYQKLPVRVIQYMLECTWHELQVEFLLQKNRAHRKTMFYLPPQKSTQLCAILLSL